MNSKPAPSVCGRPLVHDRAVRDDRRIRAATPGWPPSAPAASAPEPSSPGAAAPAWHRTPRRNVRRERCFLVMNIVLVSLIASMTALDSSLRTVALLRLLHLKRRALRRSDDERREPVVVCAPRRARSRGRPACRNAPGRGRGRRSAAFPSSCRRTAPGASAAPAAAPPGRRPSCRRPAGRRRRSAPAVVLRPPLRRSRRSSRARTRADPSRAWQLAHAGFLRCSSIRSRTDSGLAAFVVFLERRHVRRRRRRRRAEDVLENPLAAQHRRRAVRIRRHRQDAALPSSPRRVSSVSVTRRKWLP